MTKSNSRSKNILYHKITMVTIEPHYTVRSPLGVPNYMFMVRNIMLI